MAPPFGDESDPVDLSQYKTAAGAAKRTYRTLREIAEEMGQDPDEVRLYDPEETRQKRDMSGTGNVWTVSWEGGPYGWATALTGGESIYWNEFGQTGLGPEIVGLSYDGPRWGVECYYSFDLQFFTYDTGGEC